MDAGNSHRGWAKRSGDFSPEYRAQIGPNEVNEMFVAVFEYYTTEGTLIPELGRSSGHHPVHFHGRGYEDIIGIGINDDSSKVMVKYFLELVDIGMFLTGAIEDLLPDSPDNRFNVIYSAETLQCVHPDDTQVFEEIAHISLGLVIITENEDNGPTRGYSDSEVSYANNDLLLHRRNRRDELSEFDPAQLFCEPGKRDTVRVFRVF